MGKLWVGFHRFLFPACIRFLQDAQCPASREKEPVKLSASFLRRQVGVRIVKIHTSGATGLLSQDQYPAAPHAMVQKYECDFCGKSFVDNPMARQRHFQGASHKRNKRAWYAAFGCEGP